MEFKLKRRKFFNQFIIYGIPSDNLYDIITPDVKQPSPFYLTPKTLYTYPPINNDNTHNTYKPFCYKNGIPVYHFIVTSSSEYESLLLEQNVFSTYNSSFVFMKPNTSSNDVNKYIYGMKFNDYYFIKSKNTNTSSNIIHVFKYEKCYLFITTHYNTLQLLEKVSMRFLQEKKLNYLNTLTHFTGLYVDSTFTSFTTNNNETTNNAIITLITSSYELAYNKALTYFNMNNNNNNDNTCCCCSYEAWLLSKCVDCYNKQTFFQVLIMLLLEQQVLFYANDIETVAFSVFMFANMIKPFKWKYTLISNLPLQQIMMLESPAPFIVGVVCDETEMKEVYRSINASCNVVKISNGGKSKVERSMMENVFEDDKCLYFLGSGIEISFWRVEKEMKDKDGLDKEMICEEIASLICEGVIKSIVEFIDKIMNDVLHNETRNVNSSGRGSVKKVKEVLNKKILNEGDEIFYNEFVDTEMFASYCIDTYKYKLN